MPYIIGLARWDQRPSFRPCVREPLSPAIPEFGALRSRRSRQWRDDHGGSTGVSDDGAPSGCCAPVVRVTSSCQLTNPSTAMLRSSTLRSRGMCGVLEWPTASRRTGQSRGQRGQHAELRRLRPNLVPGTISRLAGSDRPADGRRTGHGAPGSPVAQRIPIQQRCSWPRTAASCSPTSAFARQVPPSPTSAAGRQPRRR